MTKKTSLKIAKILFVVFIALLLLFWFVEKVAATPGPNMIMVPDSIDGIGTLDLLHYLAQLHKHITISDPISIAPMSRTQLETQYRAEHIKPNCVISGPSATIQ